MHHERLTECHLNESDMTKVMTTTSRLTTPPIQNCTFFYIPLSMHLLLITLPIDEILPRELVSFLLKLLTGFLERLKPHRQAF